MKFPGLSLVCAAAFCASLSLAATTPPKPVTVKAPAYPAELSDTGTKGRAMIAVVVSPDGRPGALQVESTDHASFADAALAVLPEWRFEPAMKDGAPVEARVVVPFDFVPPVPQQMNAHFKRKVFQTLPAAPISAEAYGKKLKAVKKIEPVYPRALARTRVTTEVHVRFVVGPDGATYNPDFVETPRKELIFPALAAVAAARFAPPVKDGQPVYVEQVATLRFAPPQPRREIRVSSGGGGYDGGGDGPD